MLEARRLNDLYFVDHDEERALRADAFAARVPFKASWPGRRLIGGAVALSSYRRATTSGDGRGAEARRR